MIIIIDTSTRRWNVKGPIPMSVGDWGFVSDAIEAIFLKVTNEEAEKTDQLKNHFKPIPSNA